MADKKMRVDEDLCIGCGVCASVCPDSFEMNDDGKAVFTGTCADCCDEAKDSCPVNAIEEE